MYSSMLLHLKNIFAAYIQFLRAVIFNVSNCKKIKSNLIFQSYTEPSSMHNGVFVNPQNRKPRPQHERGRGNKRRDKEKSELRRQPSKRSYNNNAYQHPMDDYSDLTRSSFRVRLCTSVIIVVEFHGVSDEIQYIFISK